MTATQDAVTARLRAVATGLEARFPGVAVWHGNHTRSWWAFVPCGERSRLIEAISPDELRRAIAGADGWPWPPRTSSIRRAAL